MCGSAAINHHRHGRDGSDPDLCDVCYWRKRADDAAEIEREACAKLAMDMPLKPEFDTDDCKATAFSISARIKMRSQLI